MKYRIKKSSAFKRDFKKLQYNKQFRKAFDEVIPLLMHGSPLPKKYNDHELKWKYTWLRDCHILPDVVLIYQYIDNELILSLVRIWQHNNLFE